jgi:hypothetical protein
VIDVNQRTLNLFRAGSKEDLFARLDHVFGEEMSAHFAEELLDMWTGRMAYECEGINYTLTGEPIDIHLQRSVLPGHEDTWERVLISITDISARKKAEAEHLEGIPDAVLAFIADNVVDNVRELEGSLIRVAAYSSLHRAPLTEEIAKEVLADLLPVSRPRVITPEVILEETAKMFGWTVDDLCGKSRRRPLVMARQIGMYVFRELTDYSYPKIAEEFGGRDHTTVMHACEKIRGQMAEKRVVFEQVNELISRIKHGASG